MVGVLTDHEFDDFFNKWPELKVAPNENTTTHEWPTVSGW